MIYPARLDAFGMRARFLFIIAASLLISCVVRPASAGEEYYDWFPGLSVGAGFNPDRAQVFVSPIANRSAQRVTSGLPKVEFELVQDQETRLVQQGFQLDAGLQAKKLAYSGSVSTQWRESYLQASSSFSLRMRYFANFGEYRIPMPTLIPEAEAARQLGWTEFVKRYGTHCIVGDRRQCYLNVEYVISQTSYQAMKELGFRLDASGRWVSGSASLSVRAVLSQLIENYGAQISLKITGAGGTEAPLPISSASDVDAVLEYVATRSRGITSSRPNSCGYIAVPWDELLDFTYDWRPPTDEVLFEEQLLEFTKMYTLDYRIADILDRSGNSGFYGFISASHQQQLGNALQAVRARRSAILTRIQRWAQGIEKPARVRFVPIPVKWPAAWVHFASHDAGAGSTYACRFMLLGGNRYYSVRAKNYLDNQEALASPLVPDANADDMLHGNLSIPYANANKNLDRWWFEVLNANRDVVFRVRMYKYINVHGEPPS